MTKMPYADLTPSRQPPDAALLAASIAGDDQAFTALYRRHGAVVYRFAYHWSGASAIADEVAQETFIHLHTRGGDFDAGRGELRAWLLGIARNLVRRQLSARYSETRPSFRKNSCRSPRRLHTQQTGRTTRCRRCSGTKRTVSCID